MRSTIRCVLLVEFVLGLALVAGCGGGEPLKPGPADGTTPPATEREYYEKDKALHPPKTKSTTGTTKSSPSPEK
jgi:hypothetical protein